MTRIRRALVTIAVIVALVAAQVAVGNAVISGTSGQITKIPPPAAATDNAIPSSTTLWAWDELQGQTLASNMRVDITQTGDYTTTGSLPTGLTVPAGTVVDSHYVDADHTGSTVLTGTLQFPTDVLGIIVTPGKLDSSDVLGASSTIYPGTLSSRGAEIGNGDAVRFPNLRTVTLQLTGQMDQVRILTKHDAAPTISAGGPYSTNEGSAVTLHATATDPENDPLSYSWTFNKTPATTTCTTTNTTTANPTVTCNDDAVIVATAAVTDSFHTAVTSNATVTVANVAPALGTLSAPTGQVPLANAVTVSGSFTDVSTHDTHTATVAWGDSATANATIAETNGSGSATATHTYATPGLYTVTVTLRDDDGGASVRTVVVTVNGPPTVNAGGPYNGTEGTAAGLTGTAIDPELDPLASSWTFTTVSADAGTTCTPSNTATLSPSVLCDDDAQLDGQLTVSDGVNPDVVAQTTLTVNNAAPALAPVTVAGSPIALGASGAVSSTFTDAGTHDTHSATISWGDLTTTNATINEASGTGSLSGSHLYTLPGLYTVTVTLSDDDGGLAVRTAQILVNSPPVAAAGGPYVGTEGSPMSLTGTATDANGDALALTWSYSFSGAAGTSCTEGAGGLHSATLTITCNDDATVTATLTATDGRNTTQSAPTTLLVGNAEPVVASIAQAASAPSGSTVAISAAFSDPGANDTHTASVDWGDGHTSAAALDEGSGTVTAAHGYTSDGTYTVTVSVNDDDGGLGSLTATVVSDTAPPEITGSVSPAPNGAGWNRAPVTVSWTVTDSLSPITATTGCDATTYSTDSSGATFTCQATSRGGTASKTVTVALDQVAPTLSGAATTAPNANGWYRTPVTVHWTCADDRSGIAGSCPANTTLSSEGAAVSGSASVSDVAGNSTSASSAPVAIDTHAPVTTSSPVPTWNNADVVVALTATDNLSGVAITHFQIDNGPVQSGQSALLTDEGSHTVRYWSEDVAGNVEVAKTALVNIDKSAPSIAGTAAPSANAAGWNNSDVTVSFSCSDALSGILSCSSPQTVTSQGAHQSVSGTAVDGAGNSASTSVDVSIDKAPPSITGHATAPNSHGWYNAPVTVTFSCTDALSGVASCPSAQTLSYEGAGQSATGTVLDAADNWATTTVGPIDIDLTAPTISATVTPMPNLQGWNRTAVVVHFTCADAVSGIAAGACPNDVTVSTEGMSTISRAVTDRAGNSASASATVRIDTIAPGITGAQTSAPNGAGWNNTDVTVAFTCTDSGSGIAVAGCTAPVTLHEGAAQSVTGTAVDAADNTSTTTVSGINVDETAPSLSGAPTTSPNGAGWYHAPVTIHWTCADALSGVDGPCPADSVISSEGTSSTASATVSDVAGNATSATSAPVKIDTTAPSTSISSVPDWSNTAVNVSLAATDALSGVASTVYVVDGGAQQSGTAITVHGEGIHTVQFRSTDVAGNVEAWTSATVKIDTTAPVITVSQVPVANGAGWNSSDVTVQFLCSDALSGLAFCTSPQTITSEGAGQSVTGAAVDVAGNSSTASTTVDIDKTAPTLASTVAAPNAAGWYDSPVTVTWSCGDALSGVASCPAPTTLSTDGIGQSVTGTATDAAGNPTTRTASGINIDQTAPSITATVPATSSGWYGGPVLVHWQCSDDLSGVVSCPADSVVSAEGVTTVAQTIVDNAGNSATDSVTVRIDLTAPTIVGTASPSANANGWNNSDVTVSFTCSDTLSGNATCAAPSTLGEGAAQSVTGTATDVAGNSASATVSGINVDKTAPTLSAAPTTAPNANGWYNHAVAMHWTCGDALSGVDTSTCPSDSLIATEGVGQQVAGTVFDLAGNATNATSPPVKVDVTAPMTAASPVPTGFTNGDVTVSFTATDNLSGVAQTTYSVNGGTAHTGSSVTFTTDGVFVVVYSSTDRAGNVEGVHVATVRIDKSAPTITATVTPVPNTAGWNNTSVAVAFACSDSLSGIASCTPTQTVTAEGASQLVSGTATDNAGNSASTSKSVSIDATAPTITGSLSAAPNAAGWFRTAVAASFTCGDALSGIATCSAPYTFGQGANQTRTGTATDVAGNSASTTVGPVNVDLTAPTITATPDRAPVAGIYDGPVTVHFTCSDALSGIEAGACPADVVVSADGSTTVTGSVSDRAGNTATASASITITIAGLRSVKQGILIEIQQAAVAAPVKQDSQMLKLAANDVAASLDPSLWAVGNLLTTPNGLKVFQNEKAGVQKLTQQLGRSSVSDTTLRRWIVTLTGVDRSLAVTAIGEAIAGNGNAQEIQLAQSTLAYADQRVAAGDYAESIEQDKIAWQHAEHALNRM